MKIDVEGVGRVIAARSWRLAFPAELEARFEADTVDARCRMLIVNNFIGVAIYDAFLLGDWLLVRDIFLVSLVLHLCVMTPIMGLVIAVVARRPAAVLRESILAGGIVLGTMAILGLMVLSHSPLRSSEHISVVLVILFATMVQRIRFPYVAAAGVVSLGLYLAALATLTHHDPARALVAGAVFIGVVLFSLIGCYNLEHEQRMSYLLGLRDRLRNDQLEAISRRDTLTGLGNRRALDHALARRQAARSVTPTAVLLFDVDFFKAYNDSNGHLVGDVCLKRIAGVIDSDVRLDRDNVFRFGGEEFLVLLDDCALAEARAVGERIRRSVEDVAISRANVGEGVMTVSVGVAARIVGDGATFAEVIADADRALYAAKRGGRNQVRHVEGPGHPCHAGRTRAA